MRGSSIALLAVLAAAPGSVLSAQTGHTGHAGRKPADSSFVAMQARGMKAMGVDQDRSTHHFTDLPDGGLIQLQSDADDSTTTAAIRAHFSDIEKAFSAGEFTAPMFVHATDKVPGTEVMKDLASAIRYIRRDLPRGAELRMITGDARALGAIHQFLRFQRTEHHTP